MKRYLFFSYNFSVGSTSGHGNMYFECINFPSIDRVVEIAKAKAANYTGEKEYEISVVILGWQEMTENDFINFSGE